MPTENIKHWIKNHPTKIETSSLRMPYMVRICPENRVQITWREIAIFLKAPATQAPIHVQQPYKTSNSKNSRTKRNRQNGNRPLGSAIISSIQIEWRIFIRDARRFGRMDEHHVPGAANQCGQLHGPSWHRRRTMQGMVLEIIFFPHSIQSTWRRLFSTRSTSSSTKNQEKLKKNSVWASRVVKFMIELVGKVLNFPWNSFFLGKFQRL